MNAFLVQTFNWLAQTDYNLCLIQTCFQDQCCQNHSAKNLEMSKNWFYTSLLKITRFTTISKSKCFKNNPRLWKFGKKYTAWSSQRWNSWRNFWDFKLRMKEENCFLSSLPPMGERNHSCWDVGNCQYLLFISAGRGLNKHRRLTKRVGLLCLGFGILLKCSIVLHANQIIVC